MWSAIVSRTSGRVLALGRCVRWRLPISPRRLMAPCRTSKTGNRDASARTNIPARPPPRVEDRLPLPDAPRVRESRKLDIVGSLPETATALIVTVSLGRASQRVHGRVDVATHEGEELLGTIRCGVRMWRTLLLPAMRLMARTHQIECTVREVENAPPHTQHDPIPPGELAC